MAGRPKVENRVTWDDIYKDFQVRHPYSKDKFYRFEPFGFAQIILFGQNGVRVVYDFETKMAKKMWS